MDFQKERAGREILEQDLLCTLERSRRETPAARSGACALGCLGLFGERPLAQTSASASAPCARGAGGELPGSARTRTAGPGRAASAHRDGGGWAGLPACPCARGLWDSGGRSRASEAPSGLQSPEIQPVWGKGRPGRWASASVGRCSAPRPVRTAQGSVFPDRPLLSRAAPGRPGPAGATSPPRASVGLATALTSPRSPAAGGPRTSASVRSQPAPPPEARGSARRGPP